MNAPAAPGDPVFGEGAPEAVAATEAANSSVSGANLIPVLSLGIPGSASAVFLILAMESIAGFNPGPGVFRTMGETENPELVIAFGVFTAMFFATFLNWTPWRDFHASHRCSGPYSESASSSDCAAADPDRDLRSGNAGLSPFI